MSDEQPAASAYERGSETFMGLELYVAKGSLVPRAETEILARAALAALEAEKAAGKTALRVIDMCSGSGNLGCALAAHVPTARVWAADLSPDCVALTQKNVDKLGLSAKVVVLEGDLFEPLPRDELLGSIDLVVCNPPYISTGKLAERSDLAEEPRLAFDGGPYGLSIHQRVSRDALAFLRPGGWLCFEFGLGQERQLRIVIDRARGYENVELVNDAAGNPRVLVAKKKVP